ncbi:MAG: hypothetical protein A2234_02425 [Elusimicrobia bacterium RIFOXYA2_FULL_58_8]|nr:MAG: hypothetical protein A2285_09915 [Elusimicrobia bacterium RIFOXYA12_FULL_57_11]OGS13165.1 MAG: hypothetical protein A2234_02425 [Elusimicrobia bacterium RIFOXYA2_FULL_58_8]
MNNKFNLLLLLTGILLLGFFFRTHNLTEKGIFYYDEAYFLLETKAFTEGIKEIKAGIKTGIDLAAIKNSLMEKGCIFPPGTARPSFNAIVTVSAFIFDLKDYSVFIPSAFFSTLSIFLCFLIAKKQWDTRTALTAAFLAAISAISVMYARAGFAQTTAGFFLLLGLYFYLDTLKAGAGARKTLLAGLTLGFAVTCHYGVLLSVFTLLATETLLILFNVHARKAKTVLIFLAALAAPVLAYELLSQAIKLILAGNLGSMNYRTYFEQFLYVSSNAPQKTQLSDFLTNDYFFYPRAILGFEGMLWLILLAAAGAHSLLRVVKGRSPAEAALFFQSYAILAFWIINPGQVKAPRILIIFYPILLVLAARMLTDFLSAWRTGEKNKNLFLSGFLALLFAVNAGGLMSIVNTRSFYRDAALSLREKGITEVAALFYWPIWQFYTGHKVWANLDRVKNTKELRSYSKERGIEYLVIDSREYLINLAGRKGYVFLNEILADNQPEFTMDTDTRKDILFLYDETFPETLMREISADPFMHKLKCFRIDKLKFRN